MAPDRPLAARLQDPAAAQAQRATDVLGASLVRVEGRLPQAVARSVPSTLLNLAVQRILEEEGPIGTATILVRLADAVLAGSNPAADGPVALSGSDS